MSTTNYNSSAAGTPYVRANQILIEYPENGVPVVSITQELAVVLANGTVASLGPFQSIVFTPDMVNNLTTAIPVVDPTTGAATGATTNYQTIMLGILAAIRQQQLISNP
jgi:hypothetical protein